jgi:hypothetical protein
MGAPSRSCGRAMGWWVGVGAAEDVGVAEEAAGRGESGQSWLGAGGAIGVPSTASGRRNDLSTPATSAHWIWRQTNNPPALMDLGALPIRDA